MHPGLSPALLTALARIRAALRECKPPEAMLVYQMLTSMAFQALTDALPAPKDPVVVGRSEEASQSRLSDGPGAARVHDRWLSPREGAARLNISLRTLRRRARTQPYCAFCIPQKHGFKISELGLDEHMRGERERARR